MQVYECRILNAFAFFNIVENKECALTNLICFIFVTYRKSLI